MHTHSQREKISSTRLQDQYTYKYKLYCYTLNYEQFENKIKEIISFIIASK